MFFIFTSTICDQQILFITPSYNLANCSSALIQEICREAGGELCAREYCSKGQPVGRWMVKNFFSVYMLPSPATCYEYKRTYMILVQCSLALELVFCTELSLMFLKHSFALAPSSNSNIIWMSTGIIYHPYILLSTWNYCKDLHASAAPRLASVQVNCSSFLQWCWWGFWL